MQISPSVGCFVLVPVEALVSVTAGGYFRRTARFVSLFLSLSLPLSLSVITLSFILILILPRRVTLHVRTTSLLGEDSRCRGGIVHIRFGCSRVLRKPP